MKKDNERLGPAYVNKRLSGNKYGGRLSPFLTILRTKMLATVSLLIENKVPHKLYP
jgi:hypothetical protein